MRTLPPARRGVDSQRPSSKRKSAAPKRRRIFLEQLEERSLLAVMIWDGSANNLWSNGANWVGDVAPMAGDDLVFPAVAGNLANSNDLAAGTRFNTILLQGSGYSLAGNAIELSGGLTANNTAGTNTFGLNTTLINAQTFMSANPGTTLNVTGSINTQNLVGSYFIGTAPAIVFDGQGDLIASGVISGGGGLSKLGDGTLTLAGNNTFEGTAEARQGFIRVTNNNGLGSATTAHTEVQAGAAVELRGVTTAESFVIREGGVGFGNGTDISSAGALRAGGGLTSTVSGNVEMIGGNNLIGVAAGSTLNISGQVLAGLSTGNRRLVKVGPGTLQFTGSQPNVYPGDTVVLQGRLELGKTGAGADAAIPSNLVIGDFIGGDNGAEVRLIANNQLAQINLFDAAINTITLNGSGVLNLNGNNDTTGHISMFTGPSYSPDIATGAGVLTLGGNLIVNTGVGGGPPSTFNAGAFQGTSGASPAATISGNLDLGQFFSGNPNHPAISSSNPASGTTRVISVHDSQLANIATDLDISANITGVAGVSLSKVGAGTLRLSGNNTQAGPFIMLGGVIEVGSNNAFGSGLLSLQNDGNVLRATGASRTVSNRVSLDGNVTFLGDDAVAGAENFNFTGAMTLTGTRTMLTMDPTQNVTFGGVIDEGIFGNQTLNKSGRGALSLTAANTFSGSMTINSDGGSLVLSGNGSLQNLSGLTVGIGSTLVLDNTGTVVSDRINDARSISLQGRLLFRGNAAASVTEFVGPIDPVQNVAPIIEIENTSSGAFSSVLVANAMSVSGDRPTRFVGTGLPLSAGGANRFEVTLNPGGLDDGILPQGVVAGPGGARDFATYDLGPNGFAVIPLPASAYVTDIAQASATSNVRLTGANTITSNRTVNAILFDDGASLSGVAGSVLTVAAGNFLFRGDGALSVPNVNVGNGLFNVDASRTATVSSNIFSGTIQKNGLGKLILSGDNQHAGNTLANEGVLNIQRSTAVGAAQAGTFARANASIELEETTFGPVNVGLEPLTADGTGGLSNQGAIRNVAGNNSWAGTVTVNGVSTNLLAETGGFPLPNLSAPFVRTEAGSRLTITGDVPGGGDLTKTGGGTLELGGIIARTADRSTRVLEGTLLLNNESGIAAWRGAHFVGSNAAGAPAATLRLGGSDQIADDRGVTVFGSGLFDLNGNNELIGQGLTMHISAAGAGDTNIGAGGTLTVNANTIVIPQGSGFATGSTITGGTFALQAFGVIAGAGARTLQVNEGAVGNELTITSAIVDGTGLQSVGITKTGFGQLELGGTTANTYTGTTAVSEGTLLLNKGTGTGGVAAMAGPITIGDANPQSGFAGSDVLQLMQPNQIPDLLAAIIITPTGRFNLGGNNETIGQADAQNALTLQAAATVDLAGATLTITGNINTNAAQGATLWTPVARTQILGGTLALGNLQRVLDVPDRAELPFELEVTSNITGTGGFVTSNGGTILLSGNNSGLSGDIVRNNGNFALGSDTALGSGRALLNGIITAYGGQRNIATPIVFGANTIGFLGGNNTAGVGAIGGGGNDLNFSGPINITAGTWLPSVPIAGQLTFSGEVGETLGTVTFRKQGFGTMVFANTVTLSGAHEIGQDAGNLSGIFTRVNGGTVVLRDQGTLLNSSVLVGYGGTLQIDNSGAVPVQRMNDGAPGTTVIDLGGGNLALVGKSGAATGEVFGQLRLRNNFSTSQVQSLVPATPGSSATWRFSNYNVETLVNGSNVQFVGRGVDLSGAGTNRIAFTTAPSLVDGIINTAVIAGATGFDFATVTNATPMTAPFDNFVGALTSGPNFATTLAGATGATNVKLSGSEAVAGAVTANALLLASGGIVVSGAGALTLDGGLLASRGAGNLVSLATLTLANDSVVYVDRGDLEIASVIAGAASSLAKGGAGLLELSGANTFTGAYRATGGVSQASNDLAFGTTAGNVVVSYGSTVELNGVNVPAEQINLAGLGEANFAAVGLRTVAGTSNTWNGVVSLDHNRSAIEVNTGSSLILTGIVSNQGLNKTGAGTLQFAGTAANTFAGGGLFIWQGRVEANKNNAGVGANVWNTNVTIGDNVGGPNADQLVLLFDNQLPDANNVTVTSTGRFDYGTRVETINLFSIQNGLVGSGTITGTGAGALTIVNNSSIDAISGAGGGSFGPATIDGTLVLGGSAPRIITVNDTVGVVDLNMPAVLGAASVNFQKDGAGRLVLSGNSSGYAGSITLNGGETIVQNANALGNATGNTTVNSGFTMMLDGVSSAEPLSLNGGGFGGQGVLRNISGNNSLTGGITIAGTATIGVNAGQTLNVNSPIVGSGQGLTKLLPGTLRFSGATPNTYNGTTLVSEGVLELNKTAGVDAIAGVLTVGNDSGAQDADVVRLLAADQINNGVQVQVTPSGFWDLNGNNETIGNAAQAGFNFFLGVTTGPRVATGAGTLTLGTGVGIQTQSAGGVGNPTTSSPGAIIAGNLALNNVAHNINAADSGLNIRELQLNATISGGGAGGVLSTSGAGLTHITGNNTGLTGTMTLNGGGGWVVGNNNALGSGTVNVAANSNLFTAGYGAAAGSSTITLANPITINSDLTIRGDQNLVLNGLISGQGAVAVRTVSLNTHNLASVTIGTAGISLSNDGAARTFAINNNTFNHQAATISGPIVNGAGAANHAFQKGGVGWLTLSNNANTYAGLTTVLAGVLRVTADNALGMNGSLTTNQTTVANGATLAVAAGVTLPEWLVLNNNGFGNFGSLRLLDAAPGTTETATIAGNVNFSATSYVGVDGGGANPDRLIFSGALNSGGGQMTKVGLGEMEVTGASDNGVTFTGGPSPWDDGLLVRQGSLLLNKAAALRAISGGTITVGDGSGGNNPARLILIGSGTDQIGGNLNVDIGANGQLNFGGATATESINQLQIFRLGSAAGSANTGAGTLTLNANIFASNAGVTTSATPAAMVAGNINLNGGRNVNASDSFVLDPAEDLVVSAVLSNGSINVNGDGGRTGTVAVTNAGNIYASGTTVSGQTIDFNASFTHGLNVTVAGTLVVRDGGVLGTGNVTVQAGATLVLNNAAANANRIADTATLTMNGGNLLLLGNAGGSNETVTTLTLNAGDNAGQANRLTVNSAGAGTTVLQTTNLTRGGTGTAEFIGVGADLGNATSSQILITGGTNPFVNTVLPWATVTGPAGFDLVTDADGTAGAPYFLGRVTSYNTSVNSGGIVRLNGGTDTLTADRTVDAILLENGATVNGPFTLTVGTATAGLVVTRSGTNVISTTGSAGNPAVQFGGREPLFLTEAGSSLTVSGTMNSTATARKERSGSLILSGDNDVAAGRQLTGAFNINAGTVTISNANAFGTEPGGTVQVFRRAALIIDATAGAMNIGNKAMNILGLGFNDNGTGALQTLGANQVTIGTGATAINWNANPTVVNVATGGTLTLDANIGGGGNAMIKRGAGVMQYIGNGDNSNTGAASVNGGTLVLNKTGTNRAIRGTLTVNDFGNYDDVGAATVQYAAAGTSTNVIDDVNDVVVNHNGTVDFNGQTDTWRRLTIQGGSVSNTAGGGGISLLGVDIGGSNSNWLTMNGGVIDTGTGSLTLSGTLGTTTLTPIIFNSGLATNGASRIDGNLNLGGFNRTLQINDAYLATNDLTINALISNGRVLKTGNGSLLITNGANALLADVNEEQAFTVNAGVTSFTIGFNAFGATLTTVPIPYSAATPASVIQAALERLSNIQPGNVLVTGAAGGPYNIQFSGALSGIDFATLTFTPTGGTITAGANINGAHAWEVQGTNSILAFSSDTALGTGRVIMNGSFAALIPVGNRNIANPITLFPNLNLVFGGRRDFTGNSSLTLSGPISLGTPATAQDMNLQIDDPLTSVVFSGQLGGGNSTGFLRLQKTGQGMLQLTGANSFVSPLNIAAGIVRISNSDALGARTNELVFVQDTGAAFTLTFNGATTASIPTGSSAATVAAALNALATIGGVNGSVTVTGTGVVNATTFDPFIIEFRDALAGNDVAAVTATGATVMAITRNGSGTTVASGAALELAGNLVIGEEFVTYTGVGNLPRTSTSAGFTGALRAVSGNSSIGTGKTAIQNGGGNTQVNYIGVDGGASLVLNGGIFQPTALPSGQFTNLNKVGGGILEFQGSTPNSYGTTGILEGTLRLNKSPGVNAIPFIFGGSSQVVVGDNVGVANSDQLILLAAEQIPDGSTVTIAGTGQMSTTAAQATSLSNEVQQVFIPNAGPSGQFRLQFNGVSTGDQAFGASLGAIQAALNALSTIGGVGGNVVVQGSGSGQNQLFTITFLGAFAGVNQPQVKVLSGTTAFGGVVPAVTTLTTGGIAGHETIGATVLRVAAQGAGNINLQSGTTLGLQGDVTVDTYGALVSAATGAFITGGTIELRQQSSNGAPANRNFTVADVPVADDLRIDSTLADGSLASLSAFNKAGGAASRLVLGGPGANTFAGSMTVSNGILQIEKATAFGTTLPDEVQGYVVNNALGAATGQYTLTFNAVTTAGLDARATADEVAAALNALSTIGGVGGSVTVVSVASGNTNLQYFIRFGGALAATDVAQITTNTNTLAGGATIAAGTTAQGGGLANIAGAQTVVGAGAQLELDNVGTVLNEQLTLSGSGMINETVSPFWNNGLQVAAGTGAVRNIAGNNVWSANVAGQGGVVLGANPSSFGIAAGSLTLDGLTVVSGGQHLGKTGPGVLELAGSLTNTYTGNTYVNEGTLRLNKSGTAIAINGGEIMVGDNIGGDNADVLLYAATAGADQIGNRVIRVTSSGLLDLNGVSDTNNQTIVLDIGPTSSGDVTTGAGVLTSNNQFTVVNQAGTTSTSVPATFTGIYDLSGATRNIDVRNGNAPVEFDIQGIVQVTGAFGITKIGQGTLRVSGDNTYTGTTTVNAGVLQVGHNNALGTSAGGTTVANHAALEFNSATPLAIPETAFTISGDGWNNSGTGSLNNIGPADVTLAGTISIPGMSYRNTATIGNHAANTLLTLQAATTVVGNLIVNGDGNTTMNGSVISQAISTPYFSTLQGRLFMATGLGVNAVTGGAGQGINNLVPGTAPVTAPAATANLNGVLNFPQDSDVAFSAFFGGIPGSAAFSAVYVGMVTIPTAGTYYFSVTNNDDTAAVWIDAGIAGGIASNDNFEIGERLQTVGCCNNTAVVSAVLPAGTFKIAFAVEDTGGGSGLTGRFQPGIFGVPVSGTAMPIVSTAEAGTLTKNDLGTLTLNAQNAYINTTINQGTLVANNAISAVGAGMTTVNSTGTLGGVGTILGPVVVNDGGVINPGPVAAAPGNTGILTVNNDVTFNAGSLLQIDINGTTVGADYDQLVVGGAGNVTVVGNAVPTQLNTAMVGGTTGNGFQPVNGVDSFKVINKTSAGTISVGANAFLSQVLPMLPQTSPTTVVVGGKTYSTSYNTVAGLNDGNDFVLQAVATSRVWDGRIDAGAVNVSNAWTLGTNWAGDAAPFVGDDLVFNDVGLLNGKNTPVNDFAAATSFRSINFGNTAIGSYTVTGNSVTLDVVGGGVTSDNATNVAASNTLNIDLITAANPQATTVKDGSTLTLGGAIALVAAAPLTVTNGVGADANGSAIFNGTVNGAAILTINMIGANGDATFNAAVGGVTPLASITVTTVDDLAFANTIATMGNVTQAAGTGTTTLSGGTIGGLLNVTNEAVTLGGVNLAVTGAASLTATAGSIADANAALANMSAPTLVMSATAGIATAGNPLETTVGNLEAAGGTGGVFVANTGNLTIGGISAVVGLSATGAGIAVTTTGGITITENVTASGAGANVSLTAIDAAAAGQNLVLNAASTVSSAAGSVTLNAGDNATITGNVSSGTTTTINVDFGDAETNGVGELVAGSGGALLITGVITTPIVGLGGGAFLNGNDDFDTFTLNPQTTTEFRINGNLPVSMATGDVLVMDITGTTNPNLTVPGSIAPYNGTGSGAWSFTSALRPVLFTSIEDSTITGLFHLTYDNGVTPVGNLFVTRDVTQTKLELHDGSNVGPLVYQGALASILSLRILGSTGNDIVTVDDINTLPNFAGTVPGVTDNPNIPLASEFLFDGLGGSDTLVFNITGTTASQTYAIGSGSGAAGFEGEIESIAAGINLLSYFQNVELTQRTGVGATPGALAVIGDLSANTLSIAANGAFTRTSATGYTPFEYNSNNFSALSVSGGLGGDTIELVSYGTGQTSVLNTTLNGDGGADTLRVHSTTGNTGVVTLNGGLGSDLFQLFSLANTVDGIVGPVVVDGTDGNVGGNTDTLTIVDSGDLTADTVFINAVNPAASADYRVEGITSTAGDDVILRNIDTLNYTGTQAADTIDGRFQNTTPVHDLSAVSLSGWLGDDQFLLFTSDQFGGSGVGVTPTGIASGLATINLYGDAPGNPNAGDGNDRFGETPAGLVGTGFMNVGLVVPDSTRMIRPSATTAIAIDGGEPSGSPAPIGDVIGDVLNVDVSALSNAAPVVVSTFSPGTVVAAGIQPLTWTQIEDINLVDQGKLTNVQMGDLFARTTAAADLVQFSLNPTPTNPNQVRLRITATIANYSVTGKTLIYGGGGNDTITQANLTVPAEFYGEDGDDYLSGAMNNDWLVGGLGHDRINASGGDNVVWGDNAPTLPTDPQPQDLAIGGNDVLSGLGGNDVFYGGGGDDQVSAGGGNDYINGGQGNDTLDGNDGDDRIYGGGGNDVLGGAAGNDLLSGGGGDDRLHGGTGNDVIFGGAGADEMTGGNGNDLLVTGSVVNENSSWTSFASVGNYSPATYSLGSDNDAALLALLTAWGASSDRSLIGAITHDGVDDDVYGNLGDDDFCWETADILDDLPAASPPDFNAPFMGTDERFGPT